MNQALTQYVAFSNAANVEKEAILAGLENLHRHLIELAALEADMRSVEKDARADAGFLGAQSTHRSQLHMDPVQIHQGVEDAMNKIEAFNFGKLGASAYSEKTASGRNGELAAAVNGKRPAA